MVESTCVVNGSNKALEGLPADGTCGSNLFLSFCLGSNFVFQAYDSAWPSLSSFDFPVEFITLGIQ